MKKGMEEGIKFLGVILIGLAFLMVVFKGYDAVKEVVDRIVNWLRVPESEQAQYLPEALNSVEALRFAVDAVAANGFELEPDQKCSSGAGYTDGSKCDCGAECASGKCVDNICQTCVKDKRCSFDTTIIPPAKFSYEYFCDVGGESGKCCRTAFGQTDCKIATPSQQKSLSYNGCKYTKSGDKIDATCVYLYDKINTPKEEQKLYEQSKKTVTCGSSYDLAKKELAAYEEWKKEGHCENLLNKGWTEEDCKNLYEQMTGLVLPADTSKTNYQCNVKEFALKQKVADASEWILFWGDPYFLVYWQQFHEGEDSWTARLGETFVTAVFIGTSADLLLKGSGKVITKSGKAAIGKLTDFADDLTDSAKSFFGRVDDVAKAETKIDNIVLATDRKALSEVVQTKLTDKRWLAYVTGQTKIDDFVKLSDTDKAKVYLDLLGLKPTEKYINFIMKMIKKHPKLTTAIGAAEFIAVWYDSRDAKYRFQPNSLVIKLGIENIENMYRIEPRKASEQLKNYAVVLEKPYKFPISPKYDTEFYLASPCETDLEVYSKANDAYCDHFEKYNDASIICKGPGGVALSTPTNCFNIDECKECKSPDCCRAGMSEGYDKCSLNAIYVKIKNYKEGSFCYTTDIPTVLSLATTIVVDGAVAAAVGAACVASVGTACPLAAAVAGSLVSTVAWVKLENPWPDHTIGTFP